MLVRTGLVWPSNGSSRDVRRRFCGNAHERPSMEEDGVSVMAMWPDREYMELRAI